MLRLLRSKKAQNTMEYAILIAVVIGAFTAMQLYVRRGLSARIKGGMDRIAFRTANTTIVGAIDAPKVVGVFGTNESITQYEPYYYRAGASNMTRISSDGREVGLVTNEAGFRNLTGSVSQQNGTTETVGGWAGVDKEY